MWRRIIHYYTKKYKKRKKGKITKKNIKKRRLRKRKRNKEGGKIRVKGGEIEACDRCHPNNQFFT
jgi:hypothetical protein